MQLSAFVDGELPENEAELLLRRLSQDGELRQEVAEYLAIGRLIRAEAGLAGADRLHQRVVAEIDERPLDAAGDAATGSMGRAVRPLVGFAIAATVALVAIFALQQNGSEELPGAADETFAERDGVPDMDAQLERQRAMFRNHSETSSQFGANSMNSRVVDLRFVEELDMESDAGDSTEESDDTQETTQP